MKILGKNKKLKEKVRIQTEFILKHLKLRPSTLAKLQIVINDDRYNWINWALNTKIVISPPQFKKFTYQYPGLENCPKYKINNIDEGIMSVLAHELRHVWQFETNDRPHIRYKGKVVLEWADDEDLHPDMEYDCELFTVKMLKRWREKVRNDKKRK